MRFALDRLPTDPVLLQKMLLEMADVMEQERAELTAAQATVKAQTLRIEKLEHRVARLLRVHVIRREDEAGGASADEQARAMRTLMRCMLIVFDDLRVVYADAALPGDAANRSGVHSSVESRTSTATPVAANEGTQMRRVAAPPSALRTTLVAKWLALPEK